jgi:hypothetical protein
MRRLITRLSSGDAAGGAMVRRFSVSPCVATGLTALSTRATEVEHARLCRLMRCQI